MISSRCSDGDVPPGGTGALEQRQLGVGDLELVAATDSVLKAARPRCSSDSVEKPGETLWRMNLVGVSVRFLTTCRIPKSPTSLKWLTFTSAASCGVEGDEVNTASQLGCGVL